MLEKGKSGLKKINGITCSRDAPVSSTLSSVGTGPPGTVSGPVEDAMMELL